MPRGRSRLSTLLLLGPALQRACPGLSRAGYAWRRAFDGLVCSPGTGLTEISEIDAIRIGTRKFAELSVCRGRVSF